MREVAEEQERDTKAAACETLVALMNNALHFIYETGMSKEHTAKYLGTTVEMLDAIDIEDFDEIKKQGE